MKIFAKFTLNQWIIALYIVINIGLYYARFQSIITISYGILLLGFLNDILQRRRCLHRNFIFLFP